MLIEEMIGKENIAKGRYWRLPWSLISGCTRCSPGCDHCWALAMENRFAPKNVKKPTSICIHPERFGIPLKRKRPTVFALWNDIAHESVNMRGEFIRDVFRTMAACPEHTFLVLTKRPARMKMAVDFLYETEEIKNLIPNFWPGSTVCTQPEADEKIPILLQIPAAVHFISIEPMLSPIYIPKYYFVGALPAGYGGFIDWVVLGGETGPGARPMQMEWARSIVEQCRAAGVPVFVKQIHIGGKVSKNMDEWPEDLRVRELPNVQ